MMKILLAFLAVSLLFLGQGDSGQAGKADDFTETKGTRLPPGRWGGLHINLEVKDVGAEMSFDCAHGTIEHAIMLDRKGEFSAEGSYIRERPGPTRAGQMPDARPALYRGQVAGDQMTLTVTLKGSSGKVGTYTLTRGRAGRIFRCK